MKRYLADIQGEDKGVFAISLVESPANKAQFKNPCETGLCSLSDNNEVVGLILRPEQDIYRVGEDGEEFNMYFDSKSVKFAQESFTKNLALLNSNLEHAEKAQEGVSFVESWIVEDEKADKAVKFGFTPKLGEWYVKAKIENKEVLEALKTETVKGFSLEGEFTMTESQPPKGTKLNNMNFIEKLKALLADEEKPKEEEVKAESEEVKAASIEEIAVIVEELVKQVAALMPTEEAEPTEEEMAEKKKEEEELAAAEKAKEEELAEVKIELAQLKEQVSQIPVDLPTMREALKLSSEEKEKLEDEKLAKMGIQERINYNKNR